MTDSINTRNFRSRGRCSLTIATLLAVLHTGCSSTAPATEQRAQLFGNLGSHSRSVSTSPEAQRYFDQGLTLAYAFNHDEAIRSFRKASEIDPTAAMAYWGVALANGPHINNPVMDESRSRDAWQAIQHAKSLSHSSADADNALIDALEQRYSGDPAAERATLDRAYASAMRDVWSGYPSDPDVGALFAESMMDLRPWDLWLKSSQGPGHAPTAQPGTQEVVATLERVLAIDPDHPGANHLYIHATEASPNPEKAIVAADRLRTLVPGAGHMVHMPSHIDIRTGNWKQAAEANERAIAADVAYRKKSPRQGFYHVYMAHNNHFLAFTAMMEGRREAALSAARAMVVGVPAEYIDAAPAMVDPYMSIVYDVQKRFGLWEAILKEPPPDRRLPITNALWQFNRAVAFCALGRVEDARQEYFRFNDAVEAVPSDAIMAINNARQVLSIADRMLAGELAIAEGKLDVAVKHLHEGVRIEDSLLYMEPPDWIQPVRHALGAALLKAGRSSEAEKVYRDDLIVWPENAWSLLGLSKSLRAQSRDDEANALESRVKQSWSRADINPASSCLCVP